MSKVEKAVQWMEKTAADPKHGYDQIFRWGEKGDYDCSAAVITAYENAGVPVKSKGGATYTGNLRKAFLACGFKDVTASVNRNNVTGLKRGDVLLAEGHHVAMYCGGGKEVEASINEKGTARGGKPGDQTGREFLVRSYRNYPWTHILRLEEKSSTPAASSSTSAKPATTSKPKTLKVTAKSGLNLRVDAGTNAKKICAIPHGKKVEWSGKKKTVSGQDWYQITWRGNTGYSLSKYLG